MNPSTELTPRGAHTYNSRDYGAEVVEWQTRTFEGRVGKPVRVQIPPSAPPFILTWKFPRLAHLIRATVISIAGCQPLKTQRGSVPT